MYIYTNELADRGKKKMEKKNVTFTKDGMKVGVKEMKHEDYTDKTQRYGIHNLVALRRYEPLSSSIADCICNGIVFS
jgi:hypothetical protein